MSSKHRRTIAAVFEDPVRSSILWSDVVSLFVYLGAELRQGSGSRVRVTLGEQHATFHRPHPQKETPQRTVVSIRRFLAQAGVQP